MTKQERRPNGKKTVSSTNGVGKIEEPHAENEAGPLSYTLHKNNFKMDERPKCETENHQILEENTGRKLFDLSHSNFLLDTSPEARETKAKMNYRNFIKLKKLPHSEGNNQQN